MKVLELVTLGSERKVLIKVFIFLKQEFLFELGFSWDYMIFFILKVGYFLLLWRLFYLFIN